MSTEVSSARIAKSKTDGRFLTLTGLPANQTAFRVVRKDPQTGKPVSRRVKRSDALLSLSFPAGTSDDAITAAMADWGASDYMVSETSDGRKLAKCSDAPEGAAVVTISLSDGIVASVVQPAIVKRTDVAQTSAEKGAITVAAVVFRSDTFDLAKVKTWCEGNGVGFTKATVTDTEFTVQRCDVAADAETRTIDVGGGVTAVVVRSDEQNLPYGMVEAVSEAAYGSWGWGQLDFLAALSDIEFSEAAEQAITTMRRVTERILFYSELPVALRQELIARAAEQFSSYIQTLLGALPKQVIISTRSDKGQTMSTTDNQAPAKATPEAVLISRADLDALIAKAATAQTAAAAQPGTVARADSDTAAASALAELSKSTKETADAVAALAKRMDAADAATTVTTVPDTTQATQQEQVKRADDSFAGLFGGLRGLR